MSSAATKEFPFSTNPRTLLSIVSFVGGLALFLILASSFLVSQPIGSTVHGYFYGVGSSNNIGSGPSFDRLVSESNKPPNTFEDRGKSNSTVLRRPENDVIPEDDASRSAESGGDGSKENVGKNLPRESQDKNDLSGSAPVESKNLKDSVPRSNETLEQNPNNITFSSSTTFPKDEPVSSDDGWQTDLKKNVESSSQARATDSGCDLFNGVWIYDPAGPLYTNNTCPIITQMQNCQGNGRPDKDYENRRWKPSQCNLPRFDAKKFLALMRGKTLAFIGDSVARNQMESMLCILWQVEVPINRGSKKWQRYYFSSTNTTIVRIWSSWLVHQTSEPFDFAPAGVTKLYLDALDESFMEYITGFDVVILSSGHWFVKQSVYILNNEIVGGQLWWPDKSRQMKINNVEAFGISVDTILTAMGMHQNYTGLTIVRSYSPDHYEGGAWNTGGSCTGKVAPASEGELAENGFTNMMHEKQVTGFNRAFSKKTNKSKMILMDITKAFSYRHDAHPGPYRSLDPNKITKRGPDGRPPPQDCLHWCMPGAVDTWNELVFEIMSREFQDGQDNLS